VIRLEPNLIVISYGFSDRIPNIIGYWHNFFTNMGSLLQYLSMLSWALAMCVILLEEISSPLITSRAQGILRGYRGS
jgi:hypothetical protein